MYKHARLRSMTDAELSRAVSVECLGYLGQEGRNAVPPPYAVDTALAEYAFDRLKAEYSGIENTMSSFFEVNSDRSYARELCVRMIEAVRLWRAMGLKRGERPAEIQRVR